MPGLKRQKTHDLKVRPENVFRNTHEQVKDDELIKQNRYIVSRFSGGLAKVYKDTFENYMRTEVSLVPCRKHIK